MRKRLLLLILLALILSLPAAAQDTADEQPVIETDSSTSTVSIPVDGDTGQVIWDQYLALPEGAGATFGFVQVVYPPDPSALAESPDRLLDGAWFPPIPYSMGLYPSLEPQSAAHGWMYVENSTGLLARRDMNLTDSSGSWGVSTWFMGGAKVFHIEEGWFEGYYSESPYLPDEWTGPGIDYFLRSVWFRGVLQGETMQRLLTLCNAARVGGDREDGGRDHLLIFEIPPNEIDRQNGRGSLLVWIMQGSWRIERSRLHSAYAIEITQYENIQSNIQLDPFIFRSDYLPADLYVSMDDYLLTHRNAFLDLPSDFIYDNDPSLTGNAVTGEITSGEEAGATVESGESTSETE